MKQLIGFLVLTLNVSIPDKKKTLTLIFILHFFVVPQKEIG